MPATKTLDHDAANRPSENPPRMSLRERKKLATRTALVTTARRLFAENGYENTTLEQICAEVQIHVTTFFSYFESKEELAFAQTLESLEQFRSLLRDRSPDADVMSLWWRFVHEFSLRARTEESAIMARMDQVPALKGRYANIIRDYEDELAAALSAEAGKDPETDLYARLRASVLLAAIVTGARWYVENFEQEAGVDAVIFTKMIMESFPAREKIQKEQRKFESKVRKRLPARTKRQPK